MTKDRQSLQIMLKLCLLLLIGNFSILPVTGASFFLDGEAGCKSSSYGLQFFNVSLDCSNKLCRVGDNFTIKANGTLFLRFLFIRSIKTRSWRQTNRVSNVTFLFVICSKVDVGSRLPTVVKVYPKVCHANGYLCTGILNNRVSRNLCKSLNPKDGQNCPQKGGYSMKAKIEMPNDTNLRSYINLASGSNKFLLKAQLKPLKQTYEYYMQQQAQQQEAEDEDGDGQEQGEACEEGGEDCEEEEPEDEKEPTDSLFCHIPLRYTSNDNFNVDAYFQNKVSARSWESTDRTYEAAAASSVGVVALLSLSVYGLKRRRRSQTIDDDTEEKPCSTGQDATTDFVVFGESPPPLTVV